MPERDRIAEGFALAAAAARDRGADKAAGGLAAGAAARFLSVCRALDALPRDARAQRLRQWARTSPLTQDVDGHRRALSLLAARADLALGRRWLESAPLPRPGFAPDPGLLDALERIARDASETNPEGNDR